MKREGPQGPTLRGPKLIFDVAYAHPSYAGQRPHPETSFLLIKNKLQTSSTEAVRSTYRLEE